MSHETSKKRTEPIIVDDQLFSALSSTAGEVIELVFEQLAAEHGVSITNVRAISEGKKPRGLKDYQVETLSIWINQYNKADYSVEFPDGYSFQTSDVEAVKQTLAGEPQSPKSLSIRVGSYGQIYVNISIGGWGNDIRYTVKGDIKKDVDFIVSKLSKAFENAGVENPWLHGKWPHRFVTLLMILSAVVTYFAFLSLLLPYLSQGAFAVLANLWGLAAGAMFFLADRPNRWLKELFPFVEYQYGRAKRRMTARRNLTQWVLGTILVPVAMLLVPALFRGIT